MAAAVEAVYETVVDPAVWPRAIMQVRDLIGGAGGVVFAFDHGSETIPFWQAANLDPGEGEYERHLHRINPRVPPTLAAPPGVPFWDYRVIDESEMDRHEFYDGIQRLSGVRYFVGMRVVEADGLSVFTSIERTRKQGHVEEADVALFMEIAPHIANAFRLAGEHAKDATDASLLRLMEQQRREGIILLDFAGRIIQANEEASRILAANDGLHIEDGTLASWKAADSRSFGSLIRRALDTAAGIDVGDCGLIALPRPSGALPYLVRIVPWPLGFVDPLRRPALVVLLRDPEQSTSLRRDQLATYLGLTPREATLAICLAQGQSLRSSARLLGISYNTARVHLRNIFEKIGISSQRDLIRLILAMP